MKSNKDRFKEAVEYLESHLTLETAAETLSACQISATQLQRGQHTPRASEHDDLVLMELEKTVTMMRQALEKLPEK